MSMRNTREQRENAAMMWRIWYYDSTSTVREYRMVAMNPHTHIHVLIHAQAHGSKENHTVAHRKHSMSTENVRHIPFLPGNGTTETDK